MRTRFFAWLPLTAAVLLGCGTTTPSAPSGRGPDAGAGAGGGQGEHPTDGTSVDVKMPGAAVAELGTLRQGLAELSSLTAEELAVRYPVSTVAALGYDPKAAAGLDRIQASSTPLSAAALDLLGKNGFVITDAHDFPTFTEGYANLYGAHLPLYVSMDSILDAVHRSYDEILKQTETAVLIPELAALLGGMRTRLGDASGVDAAVKGDVDFYLAVALGLLTGGAAPPVAGATPTDVASFVAQATAGDGLAARVLFGVSREIDFSQFTPRGHYTDSEDLKRYFRAMMWLGRIDFRLIETQSDGSQVFHRRQFDATVALASLLDASDLKRFEAIDGTIESFVGESDNMRVPEVGKLLADLGAAPDAVTVDAPDALIAQAILDGGYGAQRIASDVMVNAMPETGTLPLHRTFLLFGQRYTVDSHVFANVVYDRVQHGAVMRMMPSPLDAAFAAFGNDQAGVLLSSELAKYPYAPDLAAMRLLVEAHGDAFWDGNLYNLWLSSLRALSPTAETGKPAAAGMPTVTGTEPWGRRILNTQLASWAELRHDTILYAKQSYTGGNACEFPDAYVDPYPEAFAALRRFAEYGTARIVPVAARASDPAFAASVGDYFTRLGTVMSTLHDMAVSERSGAPFSADQMAFINQAVTLSPGCGTPTGSDGWYPKLVFGDAGGVRAIELDPTIADVHTQPYDEAGNEVGRVLHVGTGLVHMMVVTTDRCAGPQAYAGLVSTYYEKITEKFDRLTDERWKSEILSDPRPVTVPWMASLVAR